MLGFIGAGELETGVASRPTDGELGSILDEVHPLRAVHIRSVRSREIVQT